MIGVVLGVFAIAVSIASAWFAREQVRVARRQAGRDFGATVLVEPIKVWRRSDHYLYELRVTNAGPAVARDVSVDLVEWADERNGLGHSVDQQEVAPVLQRGEQRDVILKLPTEAARFEDRSVAYEIGADYYDDNGLRNERLALAFGGSLILLPPN